MNIKTLIIACTLSLFAAPITYAGSDHSHGGGAHAHNAPAQMIDENSAIAAASSAVTMLVEQKQSVEGAPLNAAWKETVEADKKIIKKGNGYFIISFDNKSVEKTLYFLLSNTGEIYDANYSGKFEGLKD